MPAPEHLRITYSGTLGPSVAAATEEWSCNISSRVAAAGFPTRVSTAALALALSPRWSFLTPVVNNFARLTNTRVAWIGADGKVVKDALGAYVQGDFASDVPGLVAGVEPFQVSMVLGLRTLAVAPVGRGRIYLPAPATTGLANTGQISVGARDDFATRWKNFIDAVNDTLALTAGQRVVVASSGSVPQSIPAALHEVTEVEVGRVLDTQRRRRGDVDEDRTVLPVDA